MLEHHKECECMDCIHKLLAVFLRSSRITANASPRLFSWSFVQPSLHMWGDCIAGLAALFLLCARVCEVAVLGSICSASGSHISVTHDRVKQRRSVSLTRTDDGDRPWLLSSVSYYLVSRSGLVPLCLYPLVSLKKMGERVCESVQVVPEVLCFLFSAIVVMCSLADVKVRELSGMTRCYLFKRFQV